MAYPLNSMITFSKEIAIGLQEWKSKMRTTNFLVEHLYNLLQKRYGKTCTVTYDVQKRAVVVVVYNADDDADDVEIHAEIAHIC